MTLNHKTIRIGKLRLNGPDLAAVIVFAAIAAVLFLSAPYGLTETDEPLYQVYEYRLLKGDRLFFDDWTLTPFSTIFNFVPFALFYGLTGSTAGVLLSLRYASVFLKLLVFAAVYAALRKKGFWAVLAAAMVVGAAPFGIKTLNYYFVCSCALLFAGMVFFVKKEAKPYQYALAGVAFGMAVLAEPSMAAVWFLFTLIVAVKGLLDKKNRAARLPDERVFPRGSWLYSFYGVAAAAAATLILCALFFMRAPLSGLLQGFQNALNDPERSSGVGALIARRFGVVQIYAKIFHPVLFYSYLALLPVTAIVRRFIKKTSVYFLAVLLVLYAALTVRLLIFPMREIGYAIGETVCHSLPLCLLAPVLYLFSERRDPRKLAFLLFGFAVMLCGDAISMTAFGAFSEVCAVPALLIVRDYYLDRRGVLQTEANPQKEKALRKNAGLSPAERKTISVWLVALLVFMPLAETAHLGYQCSLYETERLLTDSDAPLNTVISCGAYKGVRTTAAIAEVYEKSVSDANKIAELCDGRLYVASLAPTVYLDADVLIAAHSPYYYYQEGWERVLLWWDMHPEKRPDVIYLPYVNLSFLEYPDASVEEKLLWLRDRAEIEVTQGQIGEIVKILRWKML